jgi:Rrf2 family iron-sulfur cluster assembly transcriptional regulator
MFRISKASEYSILFLAHLAKRRKDKPVKLKNITVKTGLPYKFLSRLVLDLKKAGIIKSKEGIGGGYQFKKKPKEISLCMIIKAVEGEKGLVSCISGQCPMEKKCFHKKTWFKLQKILNQELEKIKLSDLI